MRLTASQFSAAIGLSPWCSRQKLFRILTGQIEPDPVNERMQWGIDNEANAVAAIEAATGVLFMETGERQRHYVKNGGPYEFGATPDGVASICLARGLWERMGVEAKCPQNIWDEPPAYYVPQLIGQAAIAELQSIAFGCWTPDETRVWRYEHKPEYALWLQPLLVEFMNDWAANREPKRLRKKPELPDIKLERL